jgi:hypothetical protein
MSKPTALGTLNDVIWLKLCETDPSRTKDFRKGFSGTSINPNYIYEKLTLVFGPCGIGWGVEVIQDRYVKGYEHEQTHDIRIHFWYKNGDVKSEPIPAYGCTAYVFKDKNGWHTDEDAPKKSMTDAITKASQLIGMSADIFGGQWDDNKYVAQLKKKFESGEPEDSSTSNPTDQNPGSGDKKPESKPDTKPETKSETKSDHVSKAQAGLIYHKFKDSGFSDEQIKAYIKYHYNVDTNFRLPKTAVKVIVSLFDKGELAPLAVAAGESASDDIPF